MTPFEYFEPASLSEAIGLLDPEDVDTRPVAGGTAIMLMMNAGVFRPRRLVSLRGVDERYRGLSADGGGALRIGALTPLRQIERQRRPGRRPPGGQGRRRGGRGHRRRPRLGRVQETSHQGLRGAGGRAGSPTRSRVKQAS